MPKPPLRLVSALSLSVLLACEPPDPFETSEVDSNITSGGTYVLKAGHSRLCPDGPGNSTASGALIEQWDCNGQKNQQLRFRDTGGGVYELTPQNSPNT